MALSPDFAFHLTAALRLSQLNEGFRILEAAEIEIGELAPDSSDGTRILLLLAQWIDVGYRDHRIIDKVLDGFLRTCRFRMSVEDHLRLSLVEGFRDLAGSRLDSAIERLDMVLRILADLPNSSYEALAHFWIGRAHRKKGEYEKSLKHIVKARQMADADRDDIFTAVIQIHESWLLFQKGLSREAIQTLDRAELVLKLTDHLWLWAT